ncbi:hypothetical protein WKR88_15780 [Trinickia caryophylli]|uniref:Uncharacterized protein n=1 Tax=Trinickia caryophylli TaxID=28094 RepID=A0A1X7D2Q9_TRICW|nr:hypothetical protein [Trinickia caryophylli]PMS12784.1 hypothetical protein C0Z17_08185 [Trinickia caryophylli]TRX15198.1 hypothetical protein FNF07_28855 [Trinickia caryophylli]WQE15068.1 hypothetical protein U0034_21175 [Trinickia caryophylli]SMF07765.1 hypothetical protein SAMN06295900_102325 [Trinickia caryophylli]GLU31199.1 hypothetical protein Busp01_10410 [Trinickia caryophylli]
MSLKDFFSGKTSAAAPAASGTQAQAGDAAPTPAAPTTAGSGGDSAAGTASTGSTAGTGSTASTGSAAGTGSTSTAPPSTLSGFTAQMSNTPGPQATDALNSQILQAVQTANSETAAYAANQIAVGPNMMITQAGGLVAQSAANYFDGASKLALASKSVLLKNMTEKLVQQDIKGAAEDALGVLITDLLVGTAAAVAAAAGAIEGEAAHFALDKIDQSLNKYQALLDKKG